jgi:hypothetical protein
MVAMRLRVPVVALPMCGTRPALRHSASPSAMAGSCSNTSRAAPAIQPALSATDEGLLVHHLAAGDIDQVRSILHQPQCALIDDVARLVGEQCVQRDEVAGGKELVERGVRIRRRIPQSHRAVVRIIRENPHVEAARAARHRLANAAEADDAEGAPFAVAPGADVRAEQQFRVPRCGSDPPDMYSWASGMRRATASSSAHVRSAVVSVRTPGVFVTGMPSRVAAAMSTLLKPTA